MKDKKWLEQLVKNYSVPVSNKRKKTKKILNETQLKKIINRD